MGRTRTENTVTFLWQERFRGGVCEPLNVDLQKLDTCAVGFAGKIGQ